MDALSIFAHFRGGHGEWSAWEQDELLRLKAASAAVLENQVWEDGVTDKGDPWIIAIDEDSFELSLHVARLSGEYIAVSGDLLPVSSGANLKSVVNECLTHIRSTRQETHLGDGAIIRMPVGVSAAAFGILLTERMSVVDEKQDEAPTALQISKLQSATPDSFAFVSRFPEDQEAPQADNQLPPMLEVSDVLEMGQTIATVLYPDEREAVLNRETSSGKHDTNETTIAGSERLTGKAATAHTQSPTDPTTTQTAEAASQQPVPAPTDGAANGEPAAATIDVVAPAKLVIREDKPPEEPQPDKPDDSLTKIAMSSAPKDAADPTPETSGVSLQDAILAASAIPFDALLFNATEHLDQPPPSPTEIEADPASGLWQTAESYSDIFLV